MVGSTYYQHTYSKIHYITFLYKSRPNIVSTPYIPKIDILPYRQVEAVLLIIASVKSIGSCYESKSNNRYQAAQLRRGGQLRHSRGGQSAVRWLLAGSFYLLSFAFPYFTVWPVLQTVCHPTAEMKVDSSSISFLQRNSRDEIECESLSDGTEADQYASARSAIDIEKEIQRLQSLRSYHVLELEYQDCHRRFASLAAKYFRAPLAKVVLLDMERCWSLACTGDSNEARETPRWGSIYEKAAMDPESFYCVNDLESDARHQRMRSVSGLEDFRFFASTPLLSHDSHRLGVIAVMDVERRPMPSVEDIIFLKDIASSLMELLEQKRSTLLRGVNQSTSSGLLRSARFVQDCVKDMQGEEDLQMVLGVHQKEIIHAAVANTEFMCAEFASVPMEQRHASHHKLVKERLCGTFNSINNISRAGYC